MTLGYKNRPDGIRLMKVPMTAKIKGFPFKNTKDGQCPLCGKKISKKIIKRLESRIDPPYNLRLYINGEYGLYILHEECMIDWFNILKKLMANDAKRFTLLAI